MNAARYWFKYFAIVKPFAEAKTRFAAAAPDIFCQLERQ